MLYFKPLALMMQDVSNNLTPPNKYSIAYSPIKLILILTRQDPCSHKIIFLKDLRPDIQKKYISRRIIGDLEQPIL